MFRGSLVFACSFSPEEKVGTWRIAENAKVQLSASCEASAGSGYRPARWCWRRHNYELTFKEMSEAFKQPPARLPPMYLLVSPILPSVIPRTSLFYYLFVCFSGKYFVYPLCLACASRDCLQAPCPLHTWISSTELFTTTRMAKTNPLIMAGLRDIWMHLYLGADFAKYLFGVRIEKHMVLLNIVTCHLLTCFLCYFLHTAFSCNFLDVSSARQGLCHSWHLGSSLFHLIDFSGCYMSFKNQRKMLLPFCLGAARSVGSSLATIKKDFPRNSCHTLLVLAIMLKRVLCC